MLRTQEEQRLYTKLRRAKIAENKFIRGFKWRIGGIMGNRFAAEMPDDRMARYSFRWKTRLYRRANDVRMRYTHHRIDNTKDLVKEIANMLIEIGVKAKCETTGDCTTLIIPYNQECEANHPLVKELTDG